jgi:hypothetical protein
MAFSRQSPPDLGVFPIDLDCFDSLTAGQLSQVAADRGAAMMYIVSSLDWLRNPAELETISVAAMAARLRVGEARRARLGDPFLLLARRAERLGKLQCAEDLSVAAGLLGLVAAQINAIRIEEDIRSLYSQGVDVAPCDDQVLAILSEVDQ